jgi:hypothetical protein
MLSFHKDVIPQLIKYSQQRVWKLKYSVDCNIPRVTFFYDETLYLSGNNVESVLDCLLTNEHKNAKFEKAVSYYNTVSLEKECGQSLREVLKSHLEELNIIYCNK